jgi:hypothetical protein
VIRVLGIFVGWSRGFVPTFYSVLIRRDNIRVKFLAAFVVQPLIHLLNMLLDLRVETFI